MQKNRSEVKIKLFGNLKTLVISALFVAISIVCGKYLAIPAGDFMRFSFENLPIMMASILFGPVAGVAVGVVADLVGCFLVGYTINPLVTLGAAAIGFLSGLVWRAMRAMPFALRVAVTVFAAHLVGSVGIKTFGLAAYYAFPLWQLMLWRLLNYALVGAVEGTLLYILLKNRMLMKQFSVIYSTEKD